MPRFLLDHGTPGDHDAKTSTTALAAASAQSLDEAVFRLKPKNDAPWAGAEGRTWVWYMLLADAAPAAFTLQLAAAAQVGDAKAMRRKIVFEKMSLMKRARRAGGSA